MIPQERLAPKLQSVRRELLRKYMRLQRDLSEADPATSAYQATIHAFRQMGCTLISSGFEEDLDRLLRIRLLDGGRATPRQRGERETHPELLVLDLRAL